MPSSNTITSTDFYSFTARQKIASAEMNTNFLAVRGHYLPISVSTSTAATSGTYDLGASDHYWRTNYTQFVTFPEQVSATANPPAGYRSMYVKDDGLAYLRNSAGAETAIGSVIASAGVTATSIGDFGGIVQGRLSATTNTPLTTTDATSTTIYFTPFRGNVISLYDGAKWIYKNFTEVSLAMPTTTVTMYDVFAVYTGAALALTVTAWTNDTTRATALALQNGVYVKSGSATNLYLGSVRTVTGATGGFVEDSRHRRFVWNYYNRQRRRMYVLEGTNSWNYTVASYRIANGSSDNMLQAITGVDEDSVRIEVCAMAGHSASNPDVAVGIGIDSTTTSSATLMGPFKCTTARTLIWAVYEGVPTVGYHYYAWLEYSEAVAGTTTWTGDANAPGQCQAGIQGYIMG